MQCEHYIDLILDSLDSPLAEEAEKELRVHLETCESCRSLYETYHNIDSALSTMEEPPECLKSLVMERISGEKQSTKQRQVKRYRFTAIAACAAIAVILVGLPHFTSSTTDATDQASGYIAADMAVPETMEDMSRTVAAYDGGGTAETVYVELSEAGYAGKLLVISADQEKLVYDGEKIELPSGNVVYHFSSDEIADIQMYFVSCEELLLPGEDQGDIYIMIQ